MALTEKLYETDGGTVEGTWYWIVIEGVGSHFALMESKAAIAALVKTIANGRAVAVGHAKKRCPVGDSFYCQVPKVALPVDDDGKVLASVKDIQLSESRGAFNWERRVRL